MAGRRADQIRIYDVARQEGVSIAMASKALNETGRMADAARGRVGQAAADLDFRLDAMARATVSQRNFTISLPTNDIYGRLTLPVMAGVSEALLTRESRSFSAPSRMTRPWGGSMTTPRARAREWSGSSAWDSSGSSM